MPKGPGTYGSQVGRTPKKDKKKPDLKKVAMKKMMATKKSN